MFGLPLWAIQLIIAVLQKTGMVNWAGALAAKGIVVAEQHIANLKTYSAPSDFPSEDTRGQR